MKYFNYKNGYKENNYANLGVKKRGSTIIIWVDIIDLIKY